MASSKFFITLMAWVVARGVVAALSDDMLEKIPLLYKVHEDPIEFELIDVKTAPEGTELKFAFNVKQEIKPSSTLSGDFSIVMQSPLRFEFVKQKVAFNKEESAFEKLVGGKSADARAAKYAELVKSFEKSSCDVKDFHKVLMAAFHNTSSNGLGFQRFEKSEMEQKDVTKLSQYAKQISVKTDLKTIAVGVYTWSGVFKNKLKELSSLDESGLYRDWLVAVLLKPSLKPSNPPGLCLSADPLSVKLLFKNLPATHQVVYCKGKAEFPRVAEKLIDFNLKSDMEIVLFDSYSGMNNMYVKFIFNDKDYLKKLNTTSMRISLFLPEPLEKGEIKGISKSDFTNSVHLLGPKLDKTVKVENYDAAKRVLTFTVETPVETGKEYIFGFSPKSFYSKLPKKGNWSFMVEGLVPSSYKSWEAVEADVESTVAWVSSKLNKKDSSSQSCLKKALHGAYKAITGAGKSEFTFLAVSKAIEIVLPTVVPTVSGVYEKYGHSKYMLTLSVEALRNIQYSKSTIKVMFSDDDFSLDEEVIKSFHGSEAYSFEKESKTITVDLYFTGGLALISGSAFVIPIPFVTTASINKIKNPKEWKIELINAASIKLPISEFELSPGTGFDFKPAGERNSSAKPGVVKSHYKESEGSVFYTVEVISLVAEDMLFTVIFSKAVLSLCHASVNSSAMRLFNLTCSKDGTTFDIYIRNDPQYIGQLKLFTFHMKIPGKFSTIKDSVTYGLTATGKSGRVPSNKFMPTAKLRYEELKGRSTPLVNATVKLSDAIEVKDNDALPCRSKQTRLVTVPFKGNTNGVYFMARFHNCAKPWLAADIESPYEAFSFNLYERTPKTKSSTTLLEILRIDPYTSFNGSLAQTAMRFKRFMEHTLYVLFDKETASILQKHLLAASKCRSDDRACSKGGEEEAVQLFVDEFIRSGTSGIIGDIKYGYYDESAKTLTLKRKALFPEDVTISRDTLKVSSLTSLKDVMERILDDGFVHVIPESMSETFSVLVFTKKTDTESFKATLSKHSPSKYTQSNNKVLHPVFVQVYSVYNNFTAKAAKDGCSKPAGIFYPLKKSLEAAKKVKYTDFKRVAAVKKEEETYKFTPSGRATEQEDKKTPKEPSTLKGAGPIHPKRTPKRSDFEAFLQFDELKGEMCYSNGSKGRTEFNKILENFVKTITTTMAPKNYLFASCVKFENEVDYEKKDGEYALAFNGHDLTPVTSTKEAFADKVDDRCNIFSLYTNMPHTLHFDKKFEYKQTTTI